MEETLKRIQNHKGVIGTMVVNAEGKYIPDCLLDLCRGPELPFVVVPYLTTSLLELVIKSLVRIFQL